MTSKQKTSWGLLDPASQEFGSRDEGFSPHQHPHNTSSVGRRQKKTHSKTANEAIGQSGWKITSNDDQVRIRVLKEGKAFTKKVKLVDGTKTVPHKPIKATESAFTSQYNAHKTNFQATFSSAMNKSASKDPQMLRQQN